MAQMDYDGPPPEFDAPPPDAYDTPSRSQPRRAAPVAQTPSVLPTNPIEARELAPHFSRMRESSDTAKIYEALGCAQAKFKTVKRSRQVTVSSKRTGRTYTFRYAPLDKILQMAMPRLAAAGLVLISPPMMMDHHITSLTKLVHPASGQWLECELDVPVGLGDLQEFGSALTYLRRYVITSLLNIAIDEDDDDGNAAAGNKAVFGSEAPLAQPKLPEISDSFRDTIFQQLIKRARQAEDIGDVDYLMSYWLTHAKTMERTRAKEPDAWEVLVHELDTCVGRIIHPIVAAVFRGALTAASRVEANVFESKCAAGKWKDALDSLARDLPATHKWLMAHVAIQMARFEDEAPKSPDAAARKTAEELSINDVLSTDKARAKLEPSRSAGARPGSAPPDGVDTPAVEPEEPPPEPEENWASGYAIVGLDGDPVGPPHHAQVALARDFVAHWRGLPPDDREALIEANGECLGWARENASAAMILRELDPEPTDEELAVTVPRTPTGSVMIAAFIGAVKAVLARIDTIPVLERFSRLLEASADYQSLTHTTQLKIYVRINERRALLEGLS